MFPGLEGRTEFLEMERQHGSLIRAASTADASAAIRVVAEWLRSEYPQREGYGTAWANLLDSEANL